MVPDPMARAAPMVRHRCTSGRKLRWCTAAILQIGPRLRRVKRHHVHHPFPYAALTNTPHLSDPAAARAAITMHRVSPDYERACAIGRSEARSRVSSPKSTGLIT